MRPYLTQHVHVCVADHQAVFLDLKNDNYFSIDSSQWHAIALGADKAGSEAAVDRAMLQELLDMNVLTLDASRGKEVMPARAELPTSALIDTVLEHTLTDEDLPAPRQPWAAIVVQVVRSLLQYKLILRTRGLPGIVDAARRRKARQASQLVSVDLDAARDLVRAFRLVRPFVYSAKDACLMDSAVLVTYLAHYRIFPTWIFGVQPRPFAAHSWVQAGSVVFNDVPDHVSRYTPILAI